MNHKELEDFLTICKKGSFSKAAKESYISAQGLSRIVKKLEDELSCTLVNRTASGLELTESGERFRRYAQEALAGYEKLRADIDLLQGSAEGTVRLLLAKDVLRFLMPDCLMGFQKKYPEITLSFEEYPDREAERFLVEGKGDLALSVGPFQENRYDVENLAVCRIGLLVYPEHPFAGKSLISISELRGEPLFVENDHFKINELLQRQCWAAGFEPDLAFETPDFELCYKLCRQKRGISLTIDFIHEEHKADGLLMIPIKEKEMVWQIGILVPVDQEKGVATRRFIRYLKEYMASPVSARFPSKARS